MATTILQELQAAFTRKGWTYRKLGEELGIDHAAVYRKLNGQAGIESGVELEAFAKVLGVRIQVESEG